MKEIIITILGSIAITIISIGAFVFVVGLFVVINPFAWIALALVAVFK